MRIALRQTLPSWFFLVSAMWLKGEEPSETSAPGQVGAG